MLKSETKKKIAEDAKCITESKSDPLFKNSLLGMHCAGG